MKILKFSLILSGLASVSMFVITPLQALNLSNQSQKIDNPNRVLITQMCPQAQWIRTNWYNIFGREIDEYGVGVHCQILAKREQTPRQMMQNWARSEESRLRIKDIYNNYLNRDPRQEESDKWIYSLGAGRTTTFEMDRRLLSYANRGGT